MDGPLKILVVDDSALYRQLVRNVLREVPGVEVVGAAKSGAEALAMVTELDPDLLTLDVRMPDLDGIEVLKSLKRARSRAKALMLSSFTANGAQTTTDALFEGAFDFIHKPASSDAVANRLQLRGELAEKIAAFRNFMASRTVRSSAPVPRPAPAPVIDDAEPRSDASRYDAVVIGTSTGGPAALRLVIPELPGDLPVPIFIVQHMPPNYTHSLAERLNEVSPIEVVEGVDGMVVDAGFAYIAPGGRQMKVERNGARTVIRVTDDPHEHGCRPAVDYLLRSAAAAYEGRLLAVILTGMGRDGTDGCREVKRRGGRVLAQHPEGCTVYGMPKSVIDEQLADRVIPLERMAAMVSLYARRLRYS